MDEYEKISLLGEGTFGWVHHYEHKITRDNVAIKIFKVNNETEGIPLPTLREISLLSELKHENIVSLERVFLETADKSLFLVFPLATNDLSDIIWTHQKATTPIPPPMVKSLFWQLLNGVNYLHQNWVVHRDLKPANILLMGDGKEKGTLKITDFGLARIFHDPGRPLHDDGRVVTIWYRAPELLLGAKHYTPAIDVWSLGCIFGELLHRNALFPGKTQETKDPFQKDQVEQIFSKLGKPTVDGQNPWPEVIYLPFWPQAEALTFRRQSLHPSNQSLRGTYQSEAFELLDSMLIYNPNLRITANEGLEHRYFKTDPLPIKNVLLDSRGACPKYQRRTQSQQRK